MYLNDLPRNNIQLVINLYKNDKKFEMTSYSEQNKNKEDDELRGLIESRNTWKEFCVNFPENWNHKRRTDEVQMQARKWGFS